MLLCDFANLGREIERLEAAGVPALHLDVMDGHFVPNFTYGMPIVQATRRATNLPIEVHLMIENPGQFVEPFYEAGADIITIHAEAVDDPRPVLKKIRALGALAGLAFNPPRTIESIDAYIPLCDVLLVMSVMPGYGGQQFDDRALAKLQELCGRDDVEALLEVDGGVNQETIQSCAQAGADLLAVGSAIFATDDYSVTVRNLTDQARAGAKLCPQRCG
jgi:ribulose-phosphate 3-epimerase